MTKHTWEFPPAFTRQPHAAEMVAGEPEILQSLTVLFSTAPGERFAAPDYGFDWAALLFEPEGGASNTLFNPTYLLQRLKDVLAAFEPRVDIVAVRLEPHAYEGRALVEMDLVVKASGEPLSFSRAVTV